LTATLKPGSWLNLAEFGPQCLVIGPQRSFARRSQAAAPRNCAMSRMSASPIGAPDNFSRHLLQIGLTQLGSYG